MEEINNKTSQGKTERTETSRALPDTESHYEVFKNHSVVLLQGLTSKYRKENERPPKRHHNYMC